MKKGISLIVLVITIIVMIIIAGAIIITLNNTNVINRSEEAVIASDLANAKAELTLKYSEIMIANNNDLTTDDYTAETAQALYETAYNSTTYARLYDRGYRVTTNTDLTYSIAQTAAAATPAG